MVKILWVDDEIAHLKPHIIFLEKRGFEVKTFTNGEEALEEIKENYYDLVLLDEQMPGLSGIETLEEIKNIRPNVPIVMVTKSEEESLMNEAIGRKIADYLIKPIKPNHILLTVKKLLEKSDIIKEQVTSSYNEVFRKLYAKLYEPMDLEDWKNFFKELTHWELELENSSDEGLRETVTDLIDNANNLFAKFVQDNYVQWIQEEAEERVLSHNLLRKHFLPELDEEASNIFILIDCMRYDQWKVIEPLLAQHYIINKEELYLSILPTATQYARNSIFAGMFPAEIDQTFPDYWVHDKEEGLKNLYEEELLKEQLVREKKYDKYAYEKVIHLNEGEKLLANLKSYLENKMNFFVFNFLDIIVHARSEIQIIKELAPNEAGMRALTHTWFKNSYLFKILKELSKHNVKIFITTDHGSVRVNKPIKILADRETTTNLRYKQGRNLNYEKKLRSKVFRIRKPEEAKLPKDSVSASYVFAYPDYFFVYPNNYHKFTDMFKNTFQHGGVSLQEMLVPWIELKPKGK